MFLLRTGSLPPTVDAFREALEHSLRELVRPISRPRVFVAGDNYPRLSEIRIDLSGPMIADQFPSPPQVPPANVQPVLEADGLEISAAPIVFQGAPIQFQCTAQKVKFAEANNDSGDVLLLLQHADSGKLDLSIGLRDLEQLVQAIVAPLARKQGIVMEDLRLHLSSQNERSLGAELRVRARKLFLNTQVCLTGNLEIDDQLNARLYGLDCAGEGTLGTLACGFLFPHLEQVEQKKFSLLSVPLSEVKLRDVRITIGNQLQVKAEFGSAT